MEKTLGKDYYFYNDRFGYSHYEYFSKGITIMIKKGGITTIKIYRPLTEKEQKEFIIQIEGKGRKI
jgi:hypothetical protein